MLSACSHTSISNKEQSNNGKNDIVITDKPTPENIESGHDTNDQESDNNDSEFVTDNVIHPDDEEDNKTDISQDNEEPDYTVYEDGHYIWEAPDEILDYFYGISDDILSSDTEILLAEVIDSNFLRSSLLSDSSGPDTDDNEVDFNLYKGFTELISRDDLLPSLDNFANKLSNDKSTDKEITVRLFRRLIKEIINALQLDTASIIKKYSYLRLYMY